ncbi:MAG TPA: hypothetical protein VJ851_06725 [Jatrophihabitans sp.]|nr:hypothetical protein [Jatrophihabitans sp.]
MSGPAIGAVRLRGGSITVLPQGLAGYARLLRDTAAELAGAVSPLLGRLDAEPSLLAAAVLDPAGALLIAELVAGCLVLLAAGYLHCQLLAELLLAAADSYQLADQLDRRMAPMLRAGGRLPAAVLAGLLPAPGHYLPAGPRGVLTADPELADVAVRLLATATGSWTGWAGLVGDPAGLAGALAGLYRDGPAEVTARTGLATDDRRGPPRSVTDLVRGLAVRADQDDGGGLIDVRILDGPTGRQVIVDITGTSVWNLNPLARTPQATDVGTNLRSLAGRDSIMQRGVLQALRMAGVGPNDPIMLIGHSQGGIVAARLAIDLAAGRQYRVTHLLTAGAPIGLARLPDSVSVLSLENVGDPVPQLDGADNPDRPNWLTAGLPAGADSMLSRHSIDSYLADAPELDRCRDPALDRWRAGAAGFLEAKTVRTQVFQVRRGD